MPRPNHDEPLRARVPADIERPDRIVFGLTLRQVVILTVTALILYAVWTALATVVNPLYFIAGSIPVAGAAFFLAVSRRDGISLDAWLSAAIRHHRTPHRLVPTDEEIHPTPAWVTTTSGRSDTLPLPAPLRLPAKGITADGLIDLGPDGTTALVSASTVAFGLRSTGEQNGLVAGFARWLNSLDAPTQILVRAQRVDLTHVADRIEHRAPGLPHPALEEAARSHIGFLDDLAAERELLHRQVTIAVHGRRGPGHTAHQAREAVRALAGCEVTATVLDADNTQMTLAACLDPAAPTPSWATTGIPESRHDPEDGDDA
ncbi:PrgI family protein [Micromonospora sp. RP3T]|uniref:PrgI family protein n=1 Tax=Micromonospora sp. RP3T TaxID=2135446 RepID=UPI003D747240